MIVKLRKMKIKIISILGLLCLFVVSLFSFSPTTTNSSLSGEALAKQYCGSCHLYTAPDLLDKKTWKESVLPNMGWRLGIRGLMIAHTLLWIQMKQLL